MSLSKTTLDERIGSKKYRSKNVGSKKFEMKKQYVRKYGKQIICRKKVVPKQDFDQKFCVQRYKKSLFKKFFVKKIWGPTKFGSIF